MKVTKWKCEQCGLTFERYTKGEPRRCPLCLDRGVKTFISEVRREVRKVRK